jgi:hypothetical protein
MNEPNAPKSLPAIPADLWPKVCPVIARLKPGGKMVLEIATLPENLLLPVLCRAIHHEMRWAGQWAAGIGLSSKREFPSEEALSRHSAENAARLLSIYSALHAAHSYQGALNPSPDDLKAAASRSYQTQLRDSLRRNSQDEEESSPTTFTSDQPKSDLSANPIPSIHHELQTNIH